MNGHRYWSVVNCSVKQLWRNWVYDGLVLIGREFRYGVGGLQPALGKAGFVGGHIGGVTGIAGQPQPH